MGWVVPLTFEGMNASKSIAALIKARDIAFKLRNDAIKAAVKPFDEEIAEYDAVINQIKNGFTNDGKSAAIGGKWGSIPKKRGRKPKEIKEGVYPIDEAIHLKFRYILKDAKHFLSIREVAERVKLYEPAENEVLIKHRFGKHIDKFKAKGYLCSYGSGLNTFYGLPEWLKENGDIKPGFEPHLNSSQKLKFLKETMDRIERDYGKSESAMSA